MCPRDRRCVTGDAFVVLLRDRMVVVYVAEVGG
jgi:hypothetical protein